MTIFIDVSSIFWHSARFTIQAQGRYEDGGKGGNMLIKLYQPCKASWRLRLPFWVILTSYFWHLLATWWYENWNLAIRFEKSKASLGFWKEKDEWFEICPVRGPFEQIWDKLDGLWRTKYQCEAWVGILQCGCSERSLYTTTGEPRKPSDKSCEDCGKYHYAGSWEHDEFHACPDHKPFFERWPSAKTLYSGRGKSPQVTGFDPYDAEDMLTEGLKDGSLDIGHQLELALAISKNELSAYCYLDRKKLASEVQEVLARGVKKRHHVSDLLDSYRNSKIDLPAKVVTRMERLEEFWNFAYWAIRLLLVAGLVALWIWHIPDWRTAVVLVATVAATWSVFRVKAWLD